MKFANNDISLTFKNDNIVTIRKNGKTYKFQYNLINGLNATSDEHFQWYMFDIGVDYAYDGNIKVFSKLVVGYSPISEHFTLIARYIRKFTRKSNEVVYLSGSFDCSQEDWDRLEKTFSDKVVWDRY